MRIILSKIPLKFLVLLFLSLTFSVSVSFGILLSQVDQDIRSRAMLDPGEGGGGTSTVNQLKTGGRIGSSGKIGTSSDPTPEQSGNTGGRTGTVRERTAISPNPLNAGITGTAGKIPSAVAPTKAPLFPRFVKLIEQFKPGSNFWRCIGNDTSPWCNSSSLTLPTLPPGYNFPAPRTIPTKTQFWSRENTVINPNLPDIYDSFDENNKNNPVEYPFILDRIANSHLYCDWGGPTQDTQKCLEGIAVGAVGSTVAVGIGEFALPAINSAIPDSVIAGIPRWIAPGIPLSQHPEFYYTVGLNIIRSLPSWVAPAVTIGGTSIPYTVAQSRCNQGELEACTAAQDIAISVFAGYTDWAWSNTPLPSRFVTRQVTVSNPAASLSEADLAADAATLAQETDRIANKITRIRYDIDFDRMQLRLPENDPRIRFHQVELEQSLEEYLTIVRSIPYMRNTNGELVTGPQLANIAEAVINGNPANYRYVNILEGNFRLNFGIIANKYNDLLPPNILLPRFTYP